MRGEDVRLFAYTDLDPQGNDRIPFRERLQAKIVEPLESEAVAVIGLGLMCDEFRLREMLDQLEGTTALEAGNGADQRRWHEFVVLHAHLHSCEHTEFVRAHEAQALHVKTRHPPCCSDSHSRIV